MVIKQPSRQEIDKDVASQSAVILFFLKSPVRGQVKSRLAATVGEDAALELYRAFVLDMLDTIEGSGFPFRICYDPPDAGEAVSSWLGRHHSYIPQEGGDLGSRMERAFRRVFQEGHDRALLIGSDIPDLPPDIFEEGFASLAHHDAVLGPAADGGYYLIGFNKDTFSPCAFQGGIEWGSAAVFSGTLARLQEASLTVKVIRPWKDVDTREDLKDLFVRNRSLPFSRSRTMIYLGEIKQRLFTTGNGNDNLHE